MELKASFAILIVLQLVSIILCANNNNKNDINYTNIENLSLENKKLASNLFVEDMARNFSNLVRLNEILNVFSIHEIGYQWSTFNGKISDNCSRDMVEYLKGLENGNMWALKMDDASGHYSDGFLFGNNYWTGSMTLCKNIVQEEDPAEAKKPEQPVNVGLSFSSINSGPSSYEFHENPPFEPGFFVIKMLINETKTAPSSRTIYIGACLPISCSINDMFVMSRDSLTNSESREVTVLGIRSPSQRRFNWWGDTTFVILFVVTFIVAILLIWGTAYDIVLRKRYAKKMLLKKYAKDLNSESSSGIGCTTYDLSSEKKNNNNCVGIGIPSGINNNNSDENLAIEPNNQEEEKLSILEELLLSFSIVTNFKAICDRSVGSDTISSIHGVRAISMVWIILGHTCIIIFKYSDNMELRKIVEKQFLFQTISNGAFSVDTFFFISGFLVSYLYFRTNAKGKLEKLSKGVNEFTAGAYHFFGLLGYRFIRLTAPYLYVLGLVEVTMKYFEHYSVFEPPTLDHINCPKYWWRNVLYINTLFPVEDMCMLWSWYLADDTQFYIIGAIILIIAVRHFKVAATTLTFFMLSSWATTAFIAFTNNHMPNSDDPLALFDKIYDKPWTRLGPYLIGMSVGWILFKTNCKIKMSKLSVTVGWTLSASCLLYLLYGLYDAELTKVSAAAYSSLSHSAWALSLAWVIIACSTGYGGWINNLLSATCLYPFSRVTYCAYLVHPIVIRIYALNSDSPIHMEVDTTMIIFMGQVVASYIASFIVSLSFEAPVVTMLKIMAPNRKRRM